MNAVHARIVHMRARTLTNTGTHTHLTHTHTHIHMHIHTHIHPHIHTSTHPHTFTSTQGLINNDMYANVFAFLLVRSYADFEHATAAFATGSGYG